jgi:hypothetical protein
VKIRQEKREIKGSVVNEKNNFKPEDREIDLSQGTRL